MNPPLPAQQLVLIGVLCALTVDFSPAQTEEKAGEERISLIALDQEFEAAYERINQPVAQLNASFAAALERLFESESAAGNLDNALAVKAEMEAFGDGSVFDPKAFDDRVTDFEALENFRTTYRAERERLRGLGKGQREELLKSFQARLLGIERHFTESGDLEAAVWARNARESLESDSRFADEPERVPEQAPFEGRIQFVAKGDVEIRHNGSHLSHRNSAPAEKRDQYIDGIIREVDFRSRDVIQIRMRSTVAYRSFIMEIESVDGTIFVPLRLEDYRYLGEGEGRDADSLGLDREAILQIEDYPERGEPDPNMRGMWQKRSNKAESPAGSEWVKCGPGLEWHNYAIVLRPEMFETTE